MSATEAQAFVTDLEAQSSLQREAEENGLEAAATEAGYELDEDDIATAVAEVAADELPDKSASPDEVGLQEDTVVGSCYDGTCYATCTNVGCDTRPGPCY